MVERALIAISNDEQAVRWPSRPPLLRNAGPAGGPSLVDTKVDAQVDVVVDALVDVVVDHGTPIEVVVNGSTVRAAGSTGVTLLDWLRDEAHCTGVKEGCAEGECGACTVLIDGTAVMGCLVPAARAAGTEVTTVEGLSDEGNLSAVQRAFVEHHAVQCGFCTPGFLMSCTALLDELPDPSPAEVRAGLAGNLCRCTGYRAIEAAVATAAGSSLSAATAVEVRS
jgi:aerobic-type carbon monoxide dehydrogenase small subunit (CoxS/CutS family)